MIEAVGLVARGSDGFRLGPLDVVVQAGAALVVLGRGGAGKSLLLRALCGLTPREAGALRVARPLGFVFQQDALDDGMTTLENVREAARARGFSDAGPRALRALEQVGLADARQKHPRALSGGMRKRAGLARALVIEPRVLLADDPTAGLDPDTAAEMLALLVAQTRGASLVLTTQDIDVVVPAFDDVLVIDHGRVAYRGAPAGLARAPRTRAFAPEPRT